MSDDEKHYAQTFWLTICLFGALAFLMGQFWRPFVVTIFAMGCMLLGIGSRWIPRVAFLIALVAVATALGFPGPGQWDELTRSIWDTAMRYLTRNA